MIGRIMIFVEDVNIILSGTCDYPTIYGQRAFIDARGATSLLKAENLSRLGSEDEIRKMWLKGNGHVQGMLLVLSVQEVILPGAMGVEGSGS